MHIQANVFWKHFSIRTGRSMCLHASELERRDVHARQLLDTPSGPSPETSQLGKTASRNQTRTFYSLTSKIRAVYYASRAFSPVKAISFYIKQIWEKRHFLFDPMCNETHERSSETIPRASWKLEINARPKRMF